MSTDDTTVDGLMEIHDRLGGAWQGALDIERGAPVRLDLDGPFVVSAGHRGGSCETTLATVPRMIRP